MGADILLSYMGMMELRGIIHAHDQFSNFNASPRFPYDCNIHPVEQLMSLYENNINVFFKTNHNTVRGYNETIEHQRNNPNSPLARIKSLMGEEVSIVNGDGKEGHVLACGIQGEIRRGLTIDELNDVVHSQGGITIAAHPYAMGPRLDGQALKCDLIEGHNSNNVDGVSNGLAIELADNNGKFIVAGGDVHVTSETGNSVMVFMVQEKDLADVDGYDIVKSMKDGNFRIERAAPNRLSDIKSHVLYQVTGNTFLTDNITQQHGGVSAKIGKYFIRKFIDNQDAWFVRPGARELLKGIRNVSEKIARGYDHRVIYASKSEQVKNYLMPVSVGRRLSDYAKGREIRDISQMTSKYFIDLMAPDFWREDKSMSFAERMYVRKLNSINDRIRGRELEAAAPVKVRYN